MFVVWNPNAGSVQSAEPIKALLMHELGAELCETKSSDEAQRLVAERIRQGEQTIVAAGGDGTINAVVNGMLQEPSTAVLGVLPLGTANDWCASLGIPDDFDAALDLIRHRVARPLDVIELRTAQRQIYYANIATGGNSHRVTEAITSDMKQFWGAFCYLRGAVGILSDLETFHVEISFDDGPLEPFDLWNIIVANGRTSAGRLLIAPRAKLDDGLLDVVIIRGGTLVDLADMSFKLMTDDYTRSDQVVYRKARKISLTSTPPILFSIDGDLVEEQPIEFRVVAGKLPVIVGAI